MRIMPEAKVIRAVLTGGAVTLATATAQAQLFVWGGAVVTNPPPFTTNVVSLATGDYHVVAMLADRSVVTWGYNSFAQTNTPPDAYPTMAVGGAEINSFSVRTDGTLMIWGRQFFSGGRTNIPPEATNIVAVSAGAGGDHGLVLRADGKVIDWGSQNYSGLLTNIPHDVRDIVAVAAGSHYAMALRSDGRVFAWGSGGQTNVPAAATNVIAIAAGYNHSAALKADGRVVTWGYLEFASGSITPPSSATNITDLNCGGVHIMALRRDGKLVAWGNGAIGQLDTPAAATNLTFVAGTGQASLAIAGSGPPVFYGPSIQRTVASGRTAFLRLQASGQYPISYQWSFMGTNVPNATNSFLAVTNALPPKAGYYTLSASNALGTTERTNLLLQVEPVIIYAQPQSQSTYVGNNVTLSTTALGLPPFTYQWLFNGNAITGATNSTLVLSNIQMNASGGYSVVISNSLGSATSSVGIVSVAPLLITSQPKAIVLFPGGVANFNVSVQSASSVSYQWRWNGNALSGATNNSLVISNLQSVQAGNYDVVLANALVTTNSSVATLSLSPVAAWGNNSWGQTNVPASATNIVRIRAGTATSAAFTGDARMLYWGLNSSSMSDNIPNDLSDIVDFAINSLNTIGLRSNGQVSVWGYSGSTFSNVPPDLTNVVAVAAGQDYFLTLKSDGSIVAWGGNSYGQTNVPLGLTNVISIDAFDLNSLALTSEGKVVAWGYYSWGSGLTNVPSSLSNVVAVAAGSLVSAALTSDGNAVVWGDTFGNPQIIPAAATNLVMIDAGTRAVTALRDDGTVLVWGAVNSPLTNLPAGLANVTAISAGEYIDLALVGEEQNQPVFTVSQPTYSLIGFEVTVPTRSGRVYRLEYKNSLSDSNWFALPLVAGTGQARVLTDPSATNVQRRFYRVRQW